MWRRWLKRLVCGSIQFRGEILLRESGENYFTCSFFGYKTDKNVPFRMKWVLEVGLRWHDQQVG
jgi:hypothetical protein